MLTLRTLGIVAVISFVRGIYEREGGHYDWMMNFVGEVAGFTRSNLDRKRVILSSVDGVIASMDGTDGSLFWRTRIGSDGLVSLVETKAGVVVGVSSKGVVSALNSWSGQLLWELDAAGNYAVSVCNADDTIQLLPSKKLVSVRGGSSSSNETSCGSPIAMSLSTIGLDDGTSVSIGAGLVMTGEKNGEVTWTRHEALAFTYRVIVVNYRQGNAVGKQELSWLIGGYKAALCLSTRFNRITIVDLVDSRVVGVIQVPISVVDIFDTRTGIELVDAGRRVVGTVDVDTMTIVETSKELGSNYRYSVDESSGDIKGSVDNAALWNVKLRGKVLAVVEQSHKQLGNVPVLVKGDASVVFKYMNPNMVVIVSALDKGIALTALDTVTGAIPMQSVIGSAGHENIFIVACDNWIVGHYYNIESERFEVIAIDLYERREDKGFYAAATGKAFKGAESAYDVATDIFVLSQQYVFPLGPITAMAVTATEKGVTPRQVVFATRRGLLAIRKDTWLNPRRPGGPKIPERLVAGAEDGLPPYDPILPVISTDFLNHALDVGEVSQIVASPTHLESTSIIVAVGKGGVFVAPVYIGHAPYDVLSPFFNYWLLYMSFSAVVGAVVVTSFIGRRKDLYDKWK